jgi:transglutaminase-like putative cysteine protease
MTRVALDHCTSYRYDRPVHLSSHVVRLRPAPQCRTPVHDYSLTVNPAHHFLNWQQDPFGNHVARLVFPDRTDELVLDVHLVADLAPLNPFDFFVEDWAMTFPFVYDAALQRDLAPYLHRDAVGPRMASWLESWRDDGTAAPVVEYLSEATQRVFSSVEYTTRLEAGVQSPDQTLAKASGSCRDTAVLLAQALRHVGLAARFVSGYLVQLADEGDVFALHAWTEVFIPGAGWIGLDPTSGLFATEGHLPLACTPDPQGAAPVAGSTEPCEATLAFVNSIARV